MTNLLTTYENLEAEFLFNEYYNSSIVISRKNHYYYPPDFTSDLQSLKDQGLSDTREFCELNVCQKPVRIIISVNTMTASMQLFHKELQRENDVFYFDQSDQTWHISDKLYELMLKLNNTDEINYAICKGICKEEIDDLKSHNHHLDFSNYPFPRFTSKKCEGICIKTLPCVRNNKKTITRCMHCKTWARNSKIVLKRKAEKDTVAGSRKRSETDVSSHHRILLLSPNSLKKRIHNMRLERKRLMKNLAYTRRKLQALTGDSSQNADDSKTGNDSELSSIELDGSCSSVDSDIVSIKLEDSSDDSEIMSIKVEDITPPKCNTTSGSGTMSLKFENIVVRSQIGPLKIEVNSVNPQITPLKFEDNSAYQILPN